MRNAAAATMVRRAVVDACVKHEPLQSDSCLLKIVITLALIVDRKLPSRQEVAVEDCFVVPSVLLAARGRCMSCSSRFAARCISLTRCFHNDVCKRLNG
jgi:hypothetical protein